MSREEQNIQTLEEAFAEFMTHLSDERKKGNCIIKAGRHWEIFYEGDFVDSVLDRMQAYEMLFDMIRVGGYDKYLSEKSVF